MSPKDNKKDEAPASTSDAASGGQHTHGPKCDKDKPHCMSTTHSNLPVSKVGSLLFVCERLMISIIFTLFS